MLVRLVPYDKRRGYLCRTYIYRGVKFTGKWKEVSPVVADELRPLTQPADPESDRPLFEVLTREEAVATEERERDEGKVARVDAAEKIDDAQLRGSKAKAAKDEADAAFAAQISDDLETPAPAPSLRSRAKRRRTSKGS